MVEDQENDESNLEFPECLGILAGRAVGSIIVLIVVRVGLPLALLWEW